MSMQGTTQNLNEIEFFDPEKRKDPFIKNQAWNKAVTDHLTPEEEILVGARLGFQQYSSKISTGTDPHNALAVILRNPQDAAINTLRNGFHRAIKPTFMPELYDMLYDKNFNRNQNITDDNIMEFINQNIPPVLYDALKEFYDVHTENVKENAKKDFFNLIIFQLVASEYIEYNKVRNNMYDENPTEEQKKINGLMSKAIKNVYTTGESAGNTYDQKGNLINITNAGFGAEITQLDLILDNFQKASPSLHVEEDPKLMMSVNKSVESALKKEPKFKQADIDRKAEEEAKRQAADEAKARNKKEAANKIEANGRMPLVNAIASGDLTKVTQLLKDGAEINQTSKYKRSFLTAIRDGFKDFPINIRKLTTTPPRTLSEIAEMSGNEKIIQTVKTHMTSQTDENKVKTPTVQTSEPSRTFEGNPSKKQSSSSVVSTLGNVILNEYKFMTANNSPKSEKGIILKAILEVNKDSKNINKLKKAIDNAKELSPEDLKQMIEHKSYGITNDIIKNNLLQHIKSNEINEPSPQREKTKI